MISTPKQISHNLPHHTSHDIFHGTDLLQRLDGVHDSGTKVYRRHCLAGQHAYRAAAILHEHAEYHGPATDVLVDVEGARVAGPWGVCQRK